MGGSVMQLSWDCVQAVSPRQTSGKLMSRFLRFACTNVHCRPGMTAWLSLAVRHSVGNASGGDGGEHRTAGYKDRHGLAEMRCCLGGHQSRHLGTSNKAAFLMHPFPPKHEQ
eukprot:1149924-Pelagomonas_calceolata.AAC.2